MHTRTKRLAIEFRRFSFILAGLITPALIFSASSCSLMVEYEDPTAVVTIDSQVGASTDLHESATEVETDQSLAIDYEGEYLELDDVALYLVTYEELPSNYLRKSEAYDLGWEPDEGNLWDIAYGAAIGGDRFGNREGLLPDEPGRDWYEADVNYEGGYRGAERLVYSDDGLIYYTDDHYESFELYDEAEGWGE